MSELDKMLDELKYKVNDGVNTLWERKLELWIKPRPSWCPEKLWVKLVNLVVHQVERVR